MHKTINTMRGRAQDDRGFTMIELLVVVVIIGVLVAIAVPLYLNYRKGASNKSAASDLRGAITALEQYYTDNGNAYPADQVGVASTNMVFPAAAGGTAQTATVSPGNTLRYNNVSNATRSGYYICAQNSDGRTIYVYNSLVGGSVKPSTRTTLALCANNGN
jgi:type IV pilus assembly protein PilA